MKERNKERMKFGRKKNTGNKERSEIKNKGNAEWRRTKEAKERR